MEKTAGDLRFSRFRTLVRRRAESKSNAMGRFSRAKRVAR
ncbi:Uncharacterized protein ToN1_49650 [Aromatoleum petrolei]|nr:Uncharacterized protein ToN1_49650 [Aromatoleum petrolei]